MSAFVLIIGAWLYTREGWTGVWLCVCCVSVLEFVDKLMGEKIGLTLAEWTLKLVQ